VVTRGKMWGGALRSDSGARKLGGRGAWRNGGGTSDGLPWCGPKDEPKTRNLNPELKTDQF